MKKTPFFFLPVMLAGFIESSVAQSKLFFSIEGSVPNDLYQIHDPGGNLTTEKIQSLAGGMYVGKAIGKRTYLETGLFFKTYWDGFGFQSSPFYIMSDAFHSLLIPVRFGYHLPIGRGFYIVPSLAGILGIKVDYYSGTSSWRGQINSSGSSLTYESSESSDASRVFPLIEPRIALEKRMGRNFGVSAFYSRSFGFSKVYHSDITYRVDSGTPQSAQMDGYGDYRGAGIRVTYRINKRDPASRVEKEPREEKRNQTYIGLSINTGNRVRTSPRTKGILPIPAVSGRVALDFHYKPSDKTLLQYGVGIGVLGYALVIKPIDTLGTSGTSVFFDYPTLHGQLHVLVGRQVMIHNKPAIVGIGGGITYYQSFLWSTSYGVSDSEGALFRGQIDPLHNEFLGFAKVSFQKKYKFINFKFEYSYHFNPVARGTYEFFHTSTPERGDMLIYQREFSIVTMFDISKRRG